MMMPGPFRIVEKLQSLGEDIPQQLLPYHRYRVMVSKEFSFDAAHHLHAYEGKCKNLHGHTYKVVFGLSGYVNDNGLTLDFEHIKKIWQEQIETYLNHRYLNETLPPMNTTSENIVVWLYEQMSNALEIEPYVTYCKDGRVEFVRLYETSTSFAEARREWMTE